MYMSPNEVEFSKEESEQFELHRVVNFDARRVGLYVLAGEVSQTSHLDPLSYRAVPAEAIRPADRTTAPSAKGPDCDAVRALRADDCQLQPLVLPQPSQT